MTAVFRKAKPNDTEVLLAMMRELYAHDEAPFDEGRSRRAAMQLMKEHEAGGVWVIEAKKAPVGYLVLTFGFSLEFGGWHGFIDELFVTAPYRGYGLGTAAIRYAESKCIRHGMIAVLLEADLANEKATRLYHRLGFHEHPRRLMVRHVRTRQQEDAQDQHSPTVDLPHLSRISL